MVGWSDPTNLAAQNAVKEYITNGKPWWEDECVRDKPPSKVLPLYMVDKVASAHTFIILVTRSIPTLSKAYIF